MITIAIIAIALGSTGGAVGLGKLALVIKHKIKELKRPNKHCKEVAGMIVRYELLDDEGETDSQRTHQTDDVTVSNIVELPCGETVVFKANPEGEVKKTQPEQDLGMSTNTFLNVKEGGVIMEFATDCRNRFLNMTDNEANRIVARDFIYRKMVERGMRTKHIARALPRAVEISFIPNEGELAAKNYRASRIAVTRKEKLARPVWRIRWREQDLFPSLKKVDPGSSAA